MLLFATLSVFFFIHSHTFLPLLSGRSAVALFPSSLNVCLSVCICLFLLPFTHFFSSALLRQQWNGLDNTQHQRTKPHPSATVRHSHASSPQLPPTSLASTASPSTTTKTPSTSPWRRAGMTTRSVCGRWWWRRMRRVVVLRWW